jgi:hypothetical protein
VARSGTILAKATPALCAFCIAVPVFAASVPIGPGFSAA